jgi:cell division transport system permease protein
MADQNAPESAAIAPADTLPPPSTAPQTTRPTRSDDLGLRRVLGDRMLPTLVGAMAFLAALALGGSVGTALLARHWQNGAATALTVQVPRADPASAGTRQAANQAGSRLDLVVTLLRGTPGIASAEPLSEPQLTDLLRPWLGEDAGKLSLPLPGVIAVHLSAGAELDDSVDLAALSQRLQAIAPGTLIESHGVWVNRLAILARSLQACAWAALLVVAGVAVAVIAVATRAGLAARRESIEIVHGLGATDSYIAARFAARATRLAGLGGVIGALAATPVLLVLADLAAPFASDQAPATLTPGVGPLLLSWIGALPLVLWLSLPGLPVIAALIGFATAQGTVRSWLRRLP